MDTKQKIQQGLQQVSNENFYSDLPPNISNCWIYFSLYEWSGQTNIIWFGTMPRSVSYGTLATFV